MTTPGQRGSAPPGAGEPAGPGRRRRRFAPHVRWGVTAVVLFFILEYLLLPDIASVRKSLSLLGEANIAGLIIGSGLEVTSLVAYAELSRTVLSPDAPHRFAQFRVNMSSLAVSHTLPGGTAPGTALSYRLLTELDVPPGTAAFGLATQGIGSAVVLNAIFWLALLISVPLRGYNPLYGFAAIVGLILFVLFAATVLLLTRGEKRAADRLHRWASHLPLVNPDAVSRLVQTVADRLKILIRTRKLLTHALTWAAANWLLDAASLWVFVFAFGRAVSPIDLLVAYGLANVLAVIPVTPSGLGIVEGVLIPTLVGFHVAKAVAILGVLCWRLVNFWLPIPLGGVAYLSLRFGPAARARREARAASGEEAGDGADGRSDATGGVGELSGRGAGGGGPGPGGGDAGGGGPGPGGGDAGGVGREPGGGDTGGDGREPGSAHGGGAHGGHPGAHEVPRPEDAPGTARHHPVAPPRGGGRSSG